MVLSFRILQRHLVVKLPVIFDLSEAVELAKLRARSIIKQAREPFLLNIDRVFDKQLDLVHAFFHQPAGYGVEYRHALKILNNFQRDKRHIVDLRFAAFPGQPAFDHFLTLLFKREVFGPVNGGEKLFGGIAL